MILRPRAITSITCVSGYGIFGAQDHSFCGRRAAAYSRKKFNLQFVYLQFSMFSA